MRNNIKYILIYITIIFICQIITGIYAFNKGNKKGKLQIIQEEINNAKENNKLYKENLEKAKNTFVLKTKIYESNIWLKRCLELQGELELKRIESNLKCPSSYLSGNFFENKYKYLEKFAIYNLQRTKEDLGLSKRLK